MSVPNWLKVGTLTTMLGFGAAAGVNAQDVDNEARQDTTEVTTQQGTDYSKTSIDRVQIMYNGQPLRPVIQDALTTGMEFDDAQDAHDLNNTLQRKLENEDARLMGLLVGRASRGASRMGGASTNGTHEISVEAYDGEEKKFTFDADDMTEQATIDATTPADSTRTRTRSRGAGDTENQPTRTRTRTRSGDSGGQQQIPEPD